MYRYEYRNKSDTRLKKIIEIRNDLQNEEKKRNKAKNYLSQLLPNHVKQRVHLNS